MTLLFIKIFIHVQQYLNNVAFKAVQTFTKESKREKG